MKLLLLVISLFAIFGCSSGGFEGSDKFEAALILKLQNSYKNNKTNPIGVIIKFSRKVSDDEIKLLEKEGIKLETVTGGIATATAMPENIIKLAGYNFIEQVQLAKQNFPTNSTGR